MARSTTEFVCGKCGNRSPRWLGRCPECGAWNQMQEQQAPSKKARGSRRKAPTVRPIRLDEVGKGDGEVRVKTGLGELDNVLGGGLVAGSLVLLGGDPGVGKSTLLLTALDHFARRGVPVLYVTAEESARQVALRADRLGVSSDALLLLAETQWSTVEAAASSTKPRVVVIDSVQTMCVEELDSVPGSVGQVREVAHRAMRLAKTSSTAVLLVGHVTKSGVIAGPKVLEHLVDTVLSFEGDSNGALRILRTLKNRFGPTGELGVFEMGDGGLVEVPDASARMLSERAHDAAGTAVTAAIEGTRPLLTEVQALVGEPGPQTPARTCVGVDRTRVLMLTAVLQKAGLQLQQSDVYVNAAGGLRLDEPSADLAIVAAIASSCLDRPIRQDTLMFGEIGLVGEIRGVSHAHLRLREAARHGFRRAIVPRRCAEGAPPGIDVQPVSTVTEALDALL